MKKIKILFFVFASVLFLSACDSSGTQEESPTVASSTQPDDPNFRISVITPVTTITTSYSPDYVFYSNRSGSISYNGSCVGNLTEAVVGNNTMKIYSASSTPPVYIPLSSGQYESCVLTVTDSEGAQKTLKIDEFVVTDPNSQTGQILLELETSLGESSSSRVQSTRTAESQRMNMRSVDSGASARSNTLTAAQVRLLILAGAKTVQQSNLLNSSDMTMAMPVIIEGTMKKMSEIGLVDDDMSIFVSSLIVGSLMKSIDKRKTHLDSSTTDSQQTPLQTLMSRMSKITIKNLRSAGISAEQVNSASSTLVSTMIQNLDEAGLSADDISTAVESISSGSVGTLGEIEGIDNSQLQESIVGITSKASESLKNLGLPSSSLSGVVEKITKGAVTGLGNIKNQNSDLSSMMEKVTEGAVKGLGKLKTGGMNQADIQSMIQKATIGAVKAIEQYPNEMVALVEKVTAGATKGLNEFDVSEISTLVEKITTGATEGIGELKNSKNMNVTDNQFGSLIEKSTGGAVKQLSSLNLGSSDIDGIVSKARNGASSVLEKMAETNSSFDLENMKKNIDNGANTAMTSQGWTFVTKVSSSSSNTWISKVNHPIDINIEFNGNVIVSGMPKLELSFYNGVKAAYYNSGSGTKNLTFRYYLKSGDESSQLRYLNSTSLKVIGGEIKSTTGKPALLVLPAPGTPMSLSGLLPKNECSGKRTFQRNGSNRCLRNDVRIDLQKPQNVQFKVSSPITPAFNQKISIDFSATDGTGVTEFMITESNQPPSDGWTKQSPVVHFSQTSAAHYLIDGDREYQLYMHFKDVVGHVTTIGFPAFKLDTTGPQGTLVINNQDEWTNSIKVQTSITGTDPHDVQEYALSETNEIPGTFFKFPTQNQKNISFSTPFNLSPSQGEKTIYLWLKDRVGNIGGPYSDVIKLDTIKPEINNVSIKSDNPSPHLAKGENKITLEFKTSEKVRKPDVSILGEKATVEPFSKNSQTHWKASVNVRDSQNIPSVMSDAKLWLDATNVDGKNNQTISNGGSVTNWLDISGNNNSVVSFSGSNYPVLQKNQYNSKDVVNFTYDALRTQNKIPIQSIFIVHKTQYTGYLGDFRNGVDDSYLWRGHIGGYWKRYYNNGTLNGSSGSTTFNNQFQISLFEADLKGNGQFHLHSRYSNNEFGSGQIAEVLIFDRGLTTDEKLNINLYLATKWGLPNEGSSQEGITAFNIKVTDLANNNSNPKTSTDDISSVKVDLTKPEKDTVQITSNNQLNPNLAKEGDTVTLTFTMSESIQKPDVTINNYPVDVYSNDNNGGVVWGAKYIIKKTDPESRVEFKILSKDLAGNIGLPIETSASPQKIEIDTVKPVFQSVSIQSNHTNPKLAKHPNKLIFNFTTSEIVKKPTNSDIDFSGVDNLVVSGTGDGKNWTISGDINKTYNGLVNFRITVEDLAGNWSDNQTTTKNGSSVLVDNIAPILSGINLVSTNANNSQAYAMPGDNITLFFTSSEPIQIPVITLADDDSLGVIDNSTNQDGTSWKVIYPVTSGEANRATTFSITYKDIVGNFGDNRTLANSNTNRIIIDTKAPVLTSLSMSSNNDNSSLAKTGDNLTLSFTANENLDPNSLKLKLNGLDKSLKGAGNKWEHIHTLVDSDTEGPFSMVLNYKDLAGNPGIEKKSTLDGSSVAFDKKAPTFSVGYSRDGPFNKDDTFDIDVQFSEALHPASKPRLKILVEKGTDYSKLLTKISSSLYRLNFSPVDGNGPAILSLENLTAMDPAGNPAVGIPVSGNSFQLDNINPTASITYANAGPYKKGDNVSLNVSYSESMDSIQKISFSGGMVESPINMVKVSDKSYRFQFPAPQGDGNVSVKLHGQDLAGNQVNQNPTSGGSWILDNTPPIALSLILSGGASQTEMENITVIAKGSDQGGIQKFCVSEASSKPADSNACWKSVNGATSLDQSFSFSLSTGFNSKTVNLWVQDRAGNVSTKNASILRVDPNKSPVIGYGHALRFNGETGTTASNIVSSSGIDVESAAFTYEAWVNWEGEGGSSCCSPVISQPRSSNGTGAVLVVNGEFGQQLIATSMRNVDSGVTLPKNEWHHIAYSYDGRNTLIYFNGQLVKSKDHGSEEFLSSSLPLVVGTEWSNNYLNRSFKGKIDEVKVWRGVRSSDEIRNDMSPGLPLSSSKMLLYWNFDEGQGGITNDHSGGNNSGNLKNMTDESWIESTIPLLFNLNENPFSNQLIGKIVASDPNNDSLTFSITSGNSDGAFRIDSGNGNLYVNNPSKFDYETKTEHTLTVKVTDGKLSDSANIKIQIQDVPETDGQYALKFDGSNDYLLINDHASLSGTDQLTLSSWFKKESGSGWMALLGKGTSDANEEYVLALNDSQIYFDVGAGGGPYLQQNASIKPGKWQHIAAVHSRNNGVSSLKVYLDGEDIGGSVNGASNAPNDNNHPFTIGIRTSNSQYNQRFKGELDDIQIWSKSLSQMEIKERMGKTLDSSDSLWQYLEAYYRMDWGTGTKAYDYSSNLNHGTLTNGPIWVESPSYDKGLVAHYSMNANAKDLIGSNHGSINGTTPVTNRHGYQEKALSFNGNGDHISVPEKSELEANSHTISLWINSNNWQSGDLISKDGESSNRQWLVGTQGTSGQIRSHVWTNHGLFMRDSSNTLSTQNWHHVLQTWDGNKLSLYLNGILDHSLNAPGTLVAGNQPLRIGGGSISGSSPFYFNGYVDDVRIYNRPMSSEEVSKLYNYEKEDSFKDGLVAHYPFNGNANDESGKGKNATLHGPTLTKDRFEQSGKAYSFDGSNDYISAPNNLKNFGIQNQFTLSSWFKVENDGSTYRMLMEDGTDYRYDSIYLGLRSSSDYVFAKLGRTTGSQVANDSIPSPNLYGGWKNLVYKYDGSNISLYLNGHPFYTKSASGDLLSGNTNLQFGRRPSGTHYFNGQLDDVRIYNKALSDQRITELYDLEKPINPIDSISNLSLWLDAKNIDGKQNTTLNKGSSISEWKDLSGNGNNATQSTVSNQPSLASSYQNNNNVISFTNTDELEIPHNESLSVGDQNYGIFHVVKKTGNNTLYLLSKGRAGHNGTNYRRYYTYLTDSLFGHEIDEDPQWYAVETSQNFKNEYRLIYTERNDGYLNNYVDGVLYNSTKLPSGYGSLDETSPTSMIIGGKPWGSTTSNMDLAEILMFKKALSQAERTQVIRHLSKKWGLELTVDSDNDGIVDVHDLDPVDPKKWMVMPSVLRKSSTDSYTPLDELELWYDSTNTDGNNNLGLSNNSNINIWSDLSGNAQHLLQSSADKQPKLYTHNSKQYISFDGSNDSLGKDINGHVLDNPTGKNVTVFTVVRPINDSGSSYILSTGGQTGSAVGYALGFSSGTGFSVLKDTSGGKLINIDEPFKKNITNLVTHSYKGSYSNYENLVNGKQVTSLIQNYSGASNGHTMLTVGRPNNGESYYGQFQIAEIVVLASTDTQKIKDIQYYLSNKWGLGSHVDSDGDGFVDTIEIAENSDAKNTNSIPQNIPSVVGESKLWLIGDNTNGVKNTGLSNGSNITRWVDFSGNGNDATITNSSYYPSLAKNTKNNLSTVLFNSDYLEFEDISNIRSVFYVLKKDKSDSNWRFFLGDDNTYHFHGGTSTILAHNSWLHSNIKNGKVFQNGSLVNPQSKAFTNDYELISIITNGNVEASQIGGDRGITGQMWKGNIAEVLIFDRAVSDDERKLIEKYLNDKWDLKKPVPVADSLMAHYTSEGPFNKSGSNIVKWEDISGNNRHITTYRGTPTISSVSRSSFGLAGSGNLNVVYGDENSGFALPFAMTSGSYTIAYMARYVGDKDNTDFNKRIFDSRSGTGKNTLWGFHGGVAGRSHNGQKGWLTYTDHIMSNPDTWLIGVETEISSRFNGKDFTKIYTHSNGNTYPLRPESGFNPTLSINYGEYTGENRTTERSRWQVAELIIWNKELSESEKIEAEEYLAQKYSHGSFKSVTPSLSAFKSLASTGSHEGWYGLYDGEQWGFGDSNWHGPGAGKFVELNDYWYWGLAFTNGSQAGHVSYSNRNGANNIHKWVSPSTNNGSYKLHIISNGGGGGGGRANGGGGGAGGMAFFYNRSNLANTEFEFEVGARGSWGGLWKSNQNGPGGDSTVRWKENGSNKSMSGYGGNEGRDSSSSTVAGGSYNIGNGDGGGPGGSSLSYSSHYGKRGGKPYEPQTVVGGQNKLAEIAKALGVVYKNGTYWWWSDFVWGTGGAGSRYGVGMDGYARDGFYGGYGWVMVIIDSNNY